MSEVKTNPFEMFDKADEEQIEQELQGAVASDMVYSFPQAGQELVGLSKAGTLNTVEAFNKVNMKKKKMIILHPEGEKLIFQEGLIIYSIPAHLEVDGKVIKKWVGSSSQPIKIKTRAGSEYADPFAAPKATSKGQRNALRGILPDELVQKQIDKWIKEKKVKNFVASASPAPELRKPAQGGIMVCEDCGQPLSAKAVAFYSKNPNYQKVCYSCNQKKKNT